MVAAVVLPLTLIGVGALTPARCTQVSGSAANSAASQACQACQACQGPTIPPTDASAQSVIRPTATPSAAPPSASPTPSASDATAGQDADASRGAPPGDGGGSGAPSGLRTAALQPFAVSSPWNTALGDAAQFSADGSTLTRSLISRASSAYINARAYSIPVYVATNSDPLGTVIVRGASGPSFHIPADATAAQGTDGHLVIVDGLTAHEFWDVERSASGQLSASYGATTDLTGQGTRGGVRASGFSAMAGLIRTSELTEIDHALVIALAADQLASGPVWPAQSQDGDASSSYSGSIPMGTLVAIPRSVDLNSLGLSAPGLALARALQNYGAYVGDRSASLTLYAEPGAESPELDAMRDDLRTRLADLLRVVTNNSSHSVGGPGNRLRPAAADLSRP